MSLLRRKQRARAHCLSRKVLEVATPHFHSHLSDKILAKYEGKLGNVIFHLGGRCPDKIGGPITKERRGKGFRT